jgi:hypothetical protein
MFSVLVAKMFVLAFFKHGCFDQISHIFLSIRLLQPDFENQLWIVQMNFLDVLNLLIDVYLVAYIANSVVLRVFFSTVRAHYFPHCNQVSKLSRHIFSIDSYSALSTQQVDMRHGRIVNVWTVKNRLIKFAKIVCHMNCVKKIPKFAKNWSARILPFFKNGVKKLWSYELVLRATGKWIADAPQFFVVD